MAALDTGSYHSSSQSENLLGIEIDRVSTVTTDYWCLIASPVENSQPDLTEIPHPTSSQTSMNMSTSMTSSLLEDFPSETIHSLSSGTNHGSSPGNMNVDDQFNRENALRQSKKIVRLNDKKKKYEMKEETLKRKRTKIELESVDDQFNRENASRQSKKLAHLNDKKNKYEMKEKILKRKQYEIDFELDILKRDQEVANDEIKLGKHHQESKFIRYWNNIRKSFRSKSNDNRHPSDPKQIIQNEGKVPQNRKQETVVLNKRREPLKAEVPAVLDFIDDMPATDV